MWGRRGGGCHHSTTGLGTNMNIDHVMMGTIISGHQQHPQQTIMLQHTFVCATCKYRLESGQHVNLISPHNMKAKITANDGANFATPDAMSVICPNCAVINVQCCHCSFTTSKDNNSTKPHQRAHLHSRKYTRHFNNCHLAQMTSASTASLTPNDGDSFFIHPPSNDIGDSGCDDDNIDTNMDVSFEQHQENGEDGGIEFGAVEITESDYYPPDGGTEYNKAVLLPSGEELLYADFVNQCVIDESLASNFPHHHVESIAMTELKRHIESAFKNNEVSRRYFLLELERWGCSGIQGIVGRALRGAVPGDILADENETSALLLLTRIMIRLTSDDRRALLKYNKYLMTMLEPYFVPGTRLPAVPTSEALLRAMVMGSDTALYDQIPRELVHGGDLEGVDDKHASISINEVIDHEMASGKDYTWLVGEDGVRNWDGIYGSPAATRALERCIARVLENGGDVNKTVFGLIVPWSDGFVSNWTRQKDNNVWIKTVTVCPPANGKKGNKHSSDTHVVVIGLSKHSHSKVVSATLDDIAELEKGVMRLSYQGGIPRLVNTSFTILAIVADRPERSTLNFCLGCTGNTSKRALYAATFDILWVPSCSRCFAARIRRTLFRGSNLFVYSKCPDCCDWDYDSEREAWKHAWPVPNDFPTEPIDDNVLLGVGVNWPSHRKVPVGSHIKPVKQSFAWMVSGVKIALLAYAIGAWRSLKMVKTYLLSFAMSSKHVIDVVESFAKYLKKELKSISNEDDRNTYLKTALETQNLVERGIIPAIWVKDSIDMSMFLEEAMHGLFLGVTATIYDVMEQFMAKENNKARFERHINQYLFDIRDFRLHFCAMKEFPKSLWISENFVAQARLTRWVYGHYFSVMNVKDAAVIDPAMRMVCSLDVMIAHLMNGEDDIDLEFTGEVIKIFLSSCVEFGKHLSSSDNCDFVEKSNFFSLLNLVEQIIDTGPLRYWWGGTYEADIGKIKPELKYLRKSQSFLATKLAAVRKAFYRKDITDRWFGDTEQTSKKSSFDAYRADSAGTIVSRYNSGEVMSVFRLKTDERVWYSAFGKERDILKVVRFHVPEESIGKEHFGTIYHHFEIDSHYYQTSKAFTEANIAEFGLMLPIPPDDTVGMYSIITNQWRSLNIKGTTSLPELPHSLFGLMALPEKIDESFVGFHISILYRFVDDETNECGLEWYDCQISEFNETTDELTVIWEEGGVDRLQLSLRNYGNRHKEGGWIFVKKD